MPDVYVSFFLQKVKLKHKIFHFTNILLNISCLSGDIYLCLNVSRSDIVGYVFLILQLRPSAGQNQGLIGEISFSSYI